VRECPSEGKRLASAGCDRASLSPLRATRFPARLAAVTLFHLLEIVYG
jgi:hypothetical protein